MLSKLTMNNHKIIRALFLVFTVSFLFLGTGCDNGAKDADEAEWHDDFEEWGDEDWADEGTEKKKEGYDPCNCIGLERQINREEYDLDMLRYQIKETEKELKEKKEAYAEDTKYFDEPSEQGKVIAEEIKELQGKLEADYKNDDEQYKELEILYMAQDACEERVRTDPRCQPEEDGGEGEGEGEGEEDGHGGEEPPAEGGFIKFEPPSLSIPAGVAD